jgi:hypothetical protein
MTYDYLSLGVSETELTALRELEKRIDNKLNSLGISYTNAWKYSKLTGKIWFDVYYPSRGDCRMFYYPLKTALYDPDQVFEDVIFRVMFE